MTFDLPVIPFLGDDAINIPVRPERVEGWAWHYTAPSNRLGITTSRQIAFEQLRLGSVLSRYRLFVPPNQREYAWEPDTGVDRLFKDFAEALDDQFYF